jgi:hypothetical protein
LTNSELVGEARETPVTVIKRNTATFTATRIRVREIRGGFFPDAITEGIAGGEFSIALQSRHNVLRGPTENAGSSRPQLVQFAI